MSKNQKNIFFHIAGLFSAHPWLKLISLLLAVIIWFYVKGERI
jgi:hypothetical protein